MLYKAFNYSLSEFSVFTGGKDPKWVRDCSKSKTTWRNFLLPDLATNCKWLNHVSRLHGKEFSVPQQGDLLIFVEAGLSITHINQESYKCTECKNLFSGVCINKFTQKRIPIYVVSWEKLLLLLNTLYSSQGSLGTEML